MYPDKINILLIEDQGKLSIYLHNNITYKMYTNIINYYHMNLFTISKIMKFISLCLYLFSIVSNAIPVEVFFDGIEHKTGGDTIQIPYSLIDETNIINSQQFRIGTYGDIVAAGGDFFGPTQESDIICQGTTQQDREQRFLKAFNQMWSPDIEQDTFKEYMNAFYDIINSQKAIVDKNKDTQKNIPKELSDTTQSFYTDFGIKVASVFLLDNKIDKDWSVLRALNMLLYNDDHFGDCLSQTYTTGHYMAMKLAAQASVLEDNDVEKNNTLMKAIAMNAFADHFLMDSFSSGHLRTPRKQIHSVCTDVLSAARQAMLNHDEDGRNGLWVRNLNGDEWFQMGDDNYFNIKQNNTVLHKALNLSQTEVWESFFTRKIQQSNVIKLFPYPDTTKNNTCSLMRVGDDGSIQIRFPRNIAVRPDGCRYVKMLESDCSSLKFLVKYALTLAFDLGKLETSPVWDDVQGVWVAPDDTNTSFFDLFGIDINAGSVAEPYTVVLYSLLIIHLINIVYNILYYYNIPSSSMKNS